MLLDFAKNDCYPEFQQIGLYQKERPFCKRASKYSLSNLVITYFINGVFERNVENSFLFPIYSY